MCYRRFSPRPSAGRSGRLSVACLIDIYPSHFVPSIQTGSRCDMGKDTNLLLFLNTTRTLIKLGLDGTGGRANESCFALTVVFVESTTQLVSDVC
ncbi:hypothetical protein VTI28DRAFT_4036 [Corynascus sepedonium]